MPRSPLSRRRFIRTAAASGVALSLPSLLVGCGDNGNTQAPVTPGSGSAGGTRTPSGTLTIGMPALLEPDHLNTAIRRPPSYHSVIANRVFRGLTTIDPTQNYKAVPDMAQTIDVSADGMLYTATLRDRIRWHDGQPLTAEDVKFTVDMVTNPANKAQSRVEFGALDAVTVRDSRTVEFRLKSPYAPFMNSLALDIVPKHVLENQDLVRGDFAQGKPIGTGSYRLVQWRRGEFVELEYNPDYYGEPPKIAKLLLRYFADPAGLLAATRTGELHVAELTPAQVSAIGNSDRFAIARMRSVSPNGVAFNMRHPLFQDARVRLALNYAVDRKAIIDAIYGGNGTAASGPLPNSPYDDTSLQAFTLDQDRVQRLMTEAGWSRAGGNIWTKDGRRFTFTLFAPGFFIDGGQLIVDQLKRAGFDASLDGTKDYAYVFSNLESVPAVTYNFGAPADPDSTYLALHSSASIDRGGFVLYYANSAVDTGLDRGRTAREDNERKAAYLTVQAEVRRDPPYLFVVAHDHLIVADKHVQGWKDGLLGNGLPVFAANLESWSLAT